MPKVINLAELEPVFAKIRAALEPDASRPGQIGTTSRAMLAILPAAARWNAHEFNTDTPVEEVTRAMAVTVANILASEVGNLDCSLDDKLRLLNKFARDCLEVAFGLLTEEVRSENVSFVEAVEAGNA